MTKLISNATGAELKAGDAVTTFRGVAGILSSYDASRNRVYVAVQPDGWHMEFYPSVIDARFASDAQPQWESDVIADEETKGGY